MTQFILCSKMVIKRSLIKTGYSLMLCLPKYWIEMHGLKRKDTVILRIDKQGNLIVRKK